MKLKTIFACTILAATLPSLANAAEKKEAGSGPNPFSDCGIGAAIFKENKVLAVTSNVIWDVGTTAVTSATLSPETCSGKTVAAAKFILDSYDSLAEETARGQGQHLDALLSILNVEKSSQAAVIASIRTQMSKNVTTAAYTTANKVEKSAQYYESVVAALPAA